MTAARPVLWVLVHDAGRTGVPVVLDRLLRWAASHPDERTGPVHVVARHGGPLVGDWSRDAASVTVLEPDGRRSLPAALAAAGRQAGFGGGLDGIGRVSGRRRLAALPRPDVVLVHGAGAVDLLPLVPAAVPVVVHGHELPIALGRSASPEALRAALDRAGTVLAVSGPVADALVERGARRDRTHLVPGVVETPPTPPPATGDGGEATASPRPRIGGIGTPGWRKGTDRFAAVAAALRATSDARWVGGAPVAHHALAVGADDPVAWLPDRADPWAALGQVGVLLVPSREDPLPLVALEAGQRGLAVVASRTGGLPALLADGRGQVVDGHDVRALAAAVDAYLRDPIAAAESGARLAEHVAATFAVDVVGPRWWSLVAGAANG